MKSQREQMPYRIQTGEKTFVFGGNANVTINGNTLEISDDTRVTPTKSTTEERFEMGCVKLISLSRSGRGTDHYPRKKGVGIGGRTSKRVGGGARSKRASVSIVYTCTEYGLKKIIVKFI